MEPFVFEPEPEINMHQQNPTVLLADLPKKEYGILKYEGNGTCSELSIDHTPYIIGSELDCDGVIPSGTVSRHHARITRKGEVYFIEDLNSSNGACRRRVTELQGKNGPSGAGNGYVCGRKV